MSIANPMSQHLIDSETKLDKVMDSSKFNLIVDAILAGKYSWACVLILRFAGYNPLHYIPYRTYNRLMKNNSQKTTLNQLQENRLKKNHKSLAAKSSTATSNQPSYNMSDLSYLEVVSQPDKQIHGGNRVYLPTDWELSENDFGFFAGKLGSTAV
ncbi:MAG: HetP family heterocyst commitment protein [Xenococcaceae cyanobacterium MO_207.B15]|nr:HetP family heterocyst commitment protein [Xenococcaceae cyanobacterium MO_207.B15]MDJ0744530.1 HetP family heterocyst commitment protein [Xenococcaceae cyanobacterium MO_167.B27]